MQLKYGMAGAALAAALTASACAQAQTWSGKASYYSAHGRTASGMKVSGLTAAHRSARFGSQLRVTNLRNQRVAIVTVTDRGPFVRGRVIDVSTQTADVLGFRRAGVTVVKVETID